jgi:hypothetical protein
VTGRAATFALLYLISLGLGLYRIQSRPASEHNWEAYALRGLLNFVQHPSAGVLKVNLGLMTDSGESIVVVGPAWLAFTVFGESYTSLRIATLLIAALAVPLTWLFGRLLWSDAVGICAALIVATSQGFLFYARTGTNVGMSLTPALAGFILLWKTISPDRRRWGLWLALLQVSLILNSWFYSPIRFLWPIAIALLAVELVLRSGSRRRFLVALVVTIAVLPAALVVITHPRNHSPVAAIETYYNGRGEQIFRIDDSADSLVNLIPVQSDQKRALLEQKSTNTLIVKVIRKNAQDLMNLLLDRRTRPAISDFSNPRGRLYSRSLVPLFLLSMLLLLWSCFKSPKSRLMLALFWGYTLPLTLTTNVHLGRLLFALPLLALLVAMPIEPIARLISKAPSLRLRSKLQRWAPAVLAFAIVLLAAVPSLRDWSKTPFTKLEGELVAGQMRTALAAAPSQQLAYVFGEANVWELESLRVAVLRMELKGRARFVDLTTGETFDSGPTNVLEHGLLTALAHPSTVPGFCTNLYVVEADIALRFADLTNAPAIAMCGRPLNAVIVHG